MGVLSLYDLAKRRLVQNIHMLDDIGDLPYSFLAPILRHIQNPQQLLDLETNCPQLQGETGDIWLRYIKRDIPKWDTKPHQPRNEKSWSKVYKKLKREAEREKEQQEEELKEKMRALQQNRAENKTQILEGREGMMASREPPTSSFGRGGGGGRSWGPPSGAPAKTGKVAFDKLRRSIFDGKQARPKATQMPSHLLQERKGTVKQAPARMLRLKEHEPPSRMVLSKAASGGVTGRVNPHPTVDGKLAPSKPVIHQRPVVKPDQAPQRPTLPAGQIFNAPKMQPQSTGGAPVRKRKREPPSVFQPKKRRV